MNRQPFSTLHGTGVPGPPQGLSQTVDSAGDAFASLAMSFASRVAEVKRLFLIRVEDSAREVYADNLEALEAQVGGLEEKLKQIRTFVDNEKAAIPKATALIETSNRLKDHLHFIETNLPPYLPTLSGTPWAPRQRRSSQARDTGSKCYGKRYIAYNGSQQAVDSEGAHNKHVDSKDSPEEYQQAKKSASLLKKMQPSQAPRKYISYPEFNSVSGYMRGRITVDKVNACIGEIANHAELNARLVAAARSQSRKLSVAERKQGLDLLHGVCRHEEVKGKMWFLESNLKTGNHLKLDKTGKGILTILRHLNRINEVRVSTDNGTTIVYTLE